MSLYELHKITHAYNGQPVLSIDRWILPSDTVTGVVGPNGSGKSTLLSLLGFIVKPTQGEIRFRGTPAEPFGESVRGKVAMLPQDSFLLKRTVYRNIAYGLTTKKDNQDVQNRINMAMEMVGLDPAVFCGRPWYALSGGEARRVALAARLALQPQVLLMDEPTTSVDVDSAQLIKEAAVYARQQWGTTLIITSHDSEWLADICDDTVHLFRGKMLGSGKQTLIFGPWTANGNGRFTKSLANNQSFEGEGGCRDTNASVAAVKARNVHLYLSPLQIPADQHRLKGILLRLSYEQAGRRTRAAVLAGGVVFNTYLPQDESEAGRFLPGREFWIGYDPKTVEWY